jgi:hypothetical protein
MSVEVDCQMYKFCPRFDETESASPFRYNPLLRDLESVWWLAISFIFCHRIRGTRQGTDLIMAEGRFKASFRGIWEC